MGYPPVARAELGALVARAVGEEVARVTQVCGLGRVVVVEVVPVLRVDPVLPLVRGWTSQRYEYWYRRYWRALSGALGGRPAGRVRRMQRRVLAQVGRGAGLTQRELVFFAAWLEHGVLGACAIV